MIVESIGTQDPRPLQACWPVLQKLAERSGVSAAAIDKIEQDRKVPTITTLVKIAAALGWPVSFLVEVETGPRRRYMFNSRAWGAAGIHLARPAWIAGREVGTADYEATGQAPAGQPELVEETRYRWRQRGRPGRGSKR